MHENLVNASSPQTALMANPEPYVGDAYLLVIVQYYMKLYKESGNTDKNILFRCCCYLEELFLGVWGVFLIGSVRDLFDFFGDDLSSD